MGLTVEFCVALTVESSLCVCVCVSEPQQLLTVSTDKSAVSAIFALTLFFRILGHTALDWDSRHH